MKKNVLVLGIVFLVLVNIFLLLFLFGKTYVKVGQGKVLDRNIKNYEKIIAQAERKIVPTEGSKSVEGLIFSQQGLEMLVDYSKSIVLTKEREGEFAGFDVKMECCDFSRTVVPESENCQCNHHLADYGLIKLMLIKGYGREQIQAEIYRWNTYFFPKEAIKTELSKRGQNNPTAVEALNYFISTKGGC